MGIVNSDLHYPHWTVTNEEIIFYYKQHLSDPTIFFRIQQTGCLDRLQCTIKVVSVSSRVVSVLDGGVSKFQRVHFAKIMILI